jgi:PASTA domain
LREYSISHLRRAGRISIPEESFDRIREARDLHKEGLGTESVRRVLREGSKTEGGELSQRLDHLHETLENLQGNVRVRPTTEESTLPSPALRTILARQSLLISAVFNLTEMVEELLLASGKPRKTVFRDVEDEIHARLLPTEQTEEQRLETPVGTPAATHRGTLVRRERFGSLRQRRRRAALAVSAALLVGAVLVSAMPILGDELGSEFSFLGGRQAAEGSHGVLAGDSRGTENEAVAPHKDKPGARESPASEGASEATDVSRPPGPEEVGRVEVPDVSNRRVGKAARILAEAGFTVTAIKTEASPEEAGTTTGTEPAAGSPAEPGAPVTLIKSGGPNWVPPGTRNGAGGTATTTQYGN